MSIIKYLNCQNIDVDLLHIPNINDETKENLCYMVFDKHRYYWNNCDLIYKNTGKNDINFWDEVKYLDFKVTTSMFEDEKSFECLKNFLTNRQKEKILHIVNTIHEKKSIFEFDEWDKICEIIDNFSTEYLTIEILNKTYWIENYTIDIEKEIQNCRKMFNCFRLEFFLYFKKNNFFHIPLISYGIDLPKQEYKKYVEL
jgi:hypothetical protein